MITFHGISTSRETFHVNFTSKTPEVYYRKGITFGAHSVKYNHSGYSFNCVTPNEYQIYLTLGQINVILCRKKHCPLFLSHAQSNTLFCIISQRRRHCTFLKSIFIWCAIRLVYNFEDILRIWFPAKSTPNMSANIASDKKF